MIWGKRLIWLMVIIELINARPSYDIETGKTIKELKNGISYMDINGDNIKDLIVVGDFVTPWGGNIYTAYSFYQKTPEGKLLYIPIEGEKGTEAVVYTHSKIGGCNVKKEITKISTVRLINTESGTYLVFAEKNCKEDINKFISDKCFVKVKVFRYDYEDKMFRKYKSLDVKRLFCDAEEVFGDSKVLHEIFYLLKGGN